MIMSDKLELEKIIRRVLILYNNETNFISETALMKFNVLTLELSKAYFDIRFCGRKFCECHPETKIIELLNDDEIKNFLKYAAGDSLYSNLYKIAENYNAITVYEHGYF